MGDGTAKPVGLSLAEQSEGLPFWKLLRLVMNRDMLLGLRHYHPWVVDDIFSQSGCAKSAFFSLIYRMNIIYRTSITIYTKTTTAPN